MASYTQEERLMSLTTAAGTDALLITKLHGNDALSRPFLYELEALAAPDTQIAFDKLLGEPATVKLLMANGSYAFFNGIIARIRQAGQISIGREKPEKFIMYRLDVMPKLWLLSHQARSRIFQQISVPDILKQVLSSLDVSYRLEGTFEPRDYCVQYRETDLNFASRLMEEEGIYYYFKHTDGAHEMTVANTPGQHASLSGNVSYHPVEGAVNPEDVILEWQKTQEIRPGKYTLWDSCFEMPGKNFEATKTITPTVTVGTTTHRLTAGQASSLEIYDYPGGYAGRFDGVAPGGGDRSSDLQKIFTDNQRTVSIRMQAETTPAVTLEGVGTRRDFKAGHSFTLSDHFSDNGVYVLTAVQHSCEQSLGAGGESGIGIGYRTRFTCLPQAIPFRPQRLTPLPFVHGTQTAVVVGNAGDEILTDKYGRVKVQFAWDRGGKNDANSSCWVRVATSWAGKQWGAVHIPRVGQEVIVSFLEGDPNQPIIVGSVYNAGEMPPYALPDNKTQSGIKSRSTLNGSADNYNELRFEDKKGSEQIFAHAEKDLITEIENDETRTVGHDRTTTIKNDETKAVKEGNESITIEKGNQTVTIQGNQTTELKQGNQSTTLDAGNQSTELKLGNQSTKIAVGKIETEALQSIELKVGQSSIKLDQTGVTIKGMMINVEGQIQVQVKGLMTQINADAMLQCKGGIVMIN